MGFTQTTRCQCDVCGTSKEVLHDNDMPNDWHEIIDHNDESRIVCNRHVIRIENKEE